MKVDIWTKTALWVIAALLFMNFAQNIFSSKPALADKEVSNIGKYQITSWGARSGRATNFSGYYIIDTTTGKVKSKHVETHLSKN